MVGCAYKYSSVKSKSESVCITNHGFPATHAQNSLAIPDGWHLYGYPEDKDECMGKKVKLDLQGCNNGQYKAYGVSKEDVVTGVEEGRFMEAMHLYDNSTA